MSLATSSLVRPLLTRHEFARFGTIATRNVSEGWFYVACDVFRRASLADASRIRAFRHNRNPKRK
jgi:hypothetical protein